MDHFKLALIIFGLWFLTGPFEGAAQGFWFGFRAFAAWYLYNFYYWARNVYRTWGVSFEDEEDHLFFVEAYAEWKKDKEDQARLPEEQRRPKIVPHVASPTPISPPITLPHSSTDFPSWTRSFNDQPNELNATPTHNLTQGNYLNQAQASYTPPSSPPPYDSCTPSPPQLYISRLPSWREEKQQKLNNLLLSTPTSLSYGQRNSTIMELLVPEILHGISAVLALQASNPFFDQACSELAHKLSPVIEELQRLSRRGVRDRKSYLLNLNFPLSDLDDVYLYIGGCIGAASKLKRKIEDISYMFGDDQEKLIRENFGIVTTTPLSNAGGMIFGVQGVYSSSQSTDSTGWNESFGSTNISPAGGPNSGTPWNGTLAPDWSGTPHSDLGYGQTGTLTGGQTSSFVDRDTAPFGVKSFNPPWVSTPGQNTAFGQPSEPAEQLKAPENKPPLMLGGYIIDDSETVAKQNTQTSSNCVFGSTATSTIIPQNGNNPFDKWAKKPTADLLPAAQTQQPDNDLFSLFLPKPKPAKPSTFEAQASNINKPIQQLDNDLFSLFLPKPKPAKPSTFEAQTSSINTPKANPFLTAGSSLTPAGTPPTSGFGFQPSKAPGTFGTGAAKGPVAFVSGGVFNQSFQQTKAPGSFGVGGDRPSRTRLAEGEDEML